MARLRIEKPSEGKDFRKKKGKNSLLRPFILFSLLCLFLIAGFLIFPFLSGGPEKLPEFEIENFSGSVEVRSEGGSWNKAARGMRLSPGGALRTGEDSEVDLLIPGRLKARLKEASELNYKKPGHFDKNDGFKLAVAKGEMFLATEKDIARDSSPLESFQLEGPGIKARAQQGYFYLKSVPDGSSMLGVMRGKAEVSGDGLWNSWKQVPSLHVAAVEAGKKFGEPKRMSREDWNRMREVYDLKLKSAAMEALQLDLSKKAGSFFDFVFDHGTFYTPKFGYSGRDFFLDDSTGESYLEIEYDVFPKGSFVGVYMKTRDLDLSHYENLNFEMRRSPDGEGAPQAIRIELKAKTGVVRAFAAKLPKNDWQPVTFPLHVKTPTLLTEMTLVFLHARVGEYKKGAVQIRRLNLTPKKTEIVETFEQGAGKVPAGGAGQNEDPRGISTNDTALNKDISPKPPAVISVKQESSSSPPSVV